MARIKTIALGLAVICIGQVAVLGQNLNANFSNESKDFIVTLTAAQNATVINTIAYANISNIDIFDDYKADRSIANDKSDSYIQKITNKVLDNKLRNSKAAESYNSYDGANIADRVLHRQATGFLSAALPPNLKISHNDGNNPVGYGSSIVLASDILGLGNAIITVEEPQCRKESEKLLQGILKGDRWALKIFDASAKSPQGLLVGSIYHLGNFDECVTIARDHEGVRTQYCLATVRLPNDRNKSIETRLGPRDDIYWAICLPSVCTSKAVGAFVSEILGNAVGNGSFVDVKPDNCYIDKPIKVTSYQIVYATIIAFFLTIAACSTVYDIFVFGPKKQSCKEVNMSTIEEFVLIFSALNNLKKIFGVKNKDELGLDCVAGIKAIAMMFVIAGHTCIFVASGPVVDSRVWDGYLESFMLAFMLSNTLLVDTFLMMSAFLFCRLLLIELDKGFKTINLLAIYAFRYLRLTPVYMIVIGFYMTWMNKVDSGPLWNHRMTLERDRCIESWWANILYINNYVKTEQLCMFQSWYLSVDTQLFILAPLIIIPLQRSRKLGIIILGAFAFISTIVPIAITYIYRWDPTLLIYAKEFEDISVNKYFQDSYMKTHMKANSYAVGLITGYLVHIMQKTKYKISDTLTTLGWTVGLTGGIAGGFSVNYFYKADYVYEPIGAAIFSGCQRLAWCIFISWLIIACIAGRGGLLGKLLSWKALLPLSRLTYCAYLMNGFVEIYTLSVVRQPKYISVIGLAMEVFGHIIITLSGAVVLSLLFESPIHRLEKLLLRKPVKRSSTSSKQALSVEIE